MAAFLQMIPGRNTQFCLFFSNWENTTGMDFFLPHIYCNTTGERKTLLTNCLGIKDVRTIYRKMFQYVETILFFTKLSEYFSWNWYIFQHIYVFRFTYKILNLKTKVSLFLSNTFSENTISSTYEWWWTFISNFWKQSGTARFQFSASVQSS